MYLVTSQLLPVTYLPIPRQMGGKYLKSYLPSKKWRRRSDEGFKSDSFKDLSLIHTNFKSDSFKIFINWTLQTKLKVFRRIKDYSLIDTNFWSTGLYSVTLPRCFDIYDPALHWSIYNLALIYLSKTQPYINLFTIWNYSPD